MLSNLLHGKGLRYALQRKYQPDRYVMADIKLSRRWQK